MSVNGVTMSATLKLYKLHSRCIHHFMQISVRSNIHATYPLQALAVIWETMCKYDKSACYVLAIFKEGLNSYPDEDEISSGQLA